MRAAVGALCVVALALLSGSGVTPVSAGLITTLEYMVPMRDGIKLHTLVDFLGDTMPTNKTTVIERSPYGPDDTERIADVYLLLDMVCVRQDIRGSKGSQGNFSLWRTEDIDVYDTLVWIGQQPWSNGKVFTVGASADGMATFSPMQYPPPHLEGQFFIVSTSSGYPICYPGGAYRQSLVQFWMDFTFPKESAQLLKTITSNEAPGLWWNPLNSTGHFGNVTWPTVHLAGWYDIFLVGHLYAFHGLQFESNPVVRGKHYITVDPLGHCQAAAKYFPRDVILGRVLLPFFQSFDLMLQNGAVAEAANHVTFYVMGSDENMFTEGLYWTTLPDWPTTSPTRYYMHGDKTLTTTPPQSGEAEFTSFEYDPLNPVPSVGGNNLELKCGPLDQTPVESRPDVLLFTTEAFSAAYPLTGALNALVYVSSNCTDTDFTAKVSDVYPDGQSRLLQDGIVRMRWRNLANSDAPEMMVPGTIYEITISMWNTSYIFTPGHKLRLAISSSNFERFSPNPNNGVPLPEANNSIPLVARNTLYHSAQYASYIELPVVTKEQLPEFHPLDALQRVADKVAANPDGHPTNPVLAKAMKAVLADPSTAVEALDRLMRPSEMRDAQAAEQAAADLNKWQSAFRV